MADDPQIKAPAIPEDIQKVAANIVANWLLRPSAEPYVVAISAAIMAERERCLNVARAEAEKRLENVGAYPAARVHDFLVVARSIERKIESGANAAANSPALCTEASPTRTGNTIGDGNHG